MEKSDGGGGGGEMGMRVKKVREIEAQEACKWLRAAGFPQYAQMYEASPQFSTRINKIAWARVSKVVVVYDNDDDDDNHDYDDENDGCGGVWKP
ncbi:hypothetical protein M0802_003703 [Mischocyttarus mexicanus]|nr:hypothetical protein M0802_003703 [Mischocyttarus mexicanus]